MNLVDKQNKGYGIYKFIEELYPICRSITGNGVKETLKHIQQIIPLDIVEIPSGTKVFDWDIPEEWNIDDAYIKDRNGNKIVDFQKSNLHVLNYSTPVNKRVSLNELKDNVFTIPEKPDLIPYRTSYYQRNWGFCMSQKQWDQLDNNEDYYVYIDSEHKKGHLVYGELCLKGKSTKEVLISTHICHPSLCNDNLSGIAIATFLAKYLQNKNLKYTYRFIFIPGTIGSIAWLSRNEENTKNIAFGLIVTLLGDKSNFTYKKSRRGNAEIDQIVEYFLEQNYAQYSIRDFIPYGYDERQFCSPGFNLPVGCFTRNPHGEFEEYHTSADNLQFISEKNLLESLNALKSIFEIVENNSTYVNLNPKCEPQLGKRGLYDKIGGTNESKKTQLATLWVLNMSDGTNSLLDIAVKSGIELDIIVKAANVLKECHLLSEKNNHE